MIKKYFAHINSKPTHERRQHAMQLATGITAFAVLVWVTTLGVRFAMTPAQLAESTGNNASQTASVVESVNGNATLMVATTTNQ